MSEVRVSVTDGAPGQHILSPLLTADSFFVSFFSAGD